jgi:hypothetical protein
MKPLTQGGFLAAVMLALLIGIVGYYALNMPDQRSPVEKAGDAIDQLKSRTPG